MKSFIKNWVLPPGMRYILSSWVYSLIRGRNFSTVKDLCRKSDRLYVLATGPSLTRDIEKYNNGVALTPPMGWSSWNTFRNSIDEKLIKDT